MGIVHRTNTIVQPYRPALGTFPLAISSNKRYLVTAQGTPFLICADSGWSMGSQLSRSQVDTYLNNRQSQNFNAIIFDFFERWWSSNTPPYMNAEGNNPFTTMTPQVDFSSPVEAYWQLIDYMILGCRNRGMLAIVCPGYYSSADSGVTNSDSLGWGVQFEGDTQAHRQAYGTFLANRYLNSTYNNVMFLVGGDFLTPSTTKLSDMTANIVSAAPQTPLITGQAVRDNDAYAALSAVTGFNVNAIYVSSGNEVSAAATAYAKAGPVPFWNSEDYYEDQTGGQEPISTPEDRRRQIHQTILSGGCGYAFGSNPVWGFGEPHNSGNIGPAATVSTKLNSSGAADMGRTLPFYTSFAWQKLVPKTDASLVSTALGTGANAICPALASDGTFAMIWFGGTSTTGTVVMTNITHGSVRARWWDASNGSYTTDAASPLANTGSHAFTTPGTNSAGGTGWILVLD